MFQTCRGKKHEDVAPEHPPPDCVSYDAVGELVGEYGAGNITPAGADFLLCYSAACGNTVVFLKYIKIMGVRMK